MANITKKLKDIEKQEAALALAKKALLEKEKQEKAAVAELETLVKKSSFESPKALVEALINHFNIRLSGKKPGRPASKKARRTRTTVTAQVRDAVKAELAKGNSVNAVSKSQGISYPVVANISKGKYDKLK